MTGELSYAEWVFWTTVIGVVFEIALFLFDFVSKRSEEILEIVLDPWFVVAFAMTSLLIFSVLLWACSELS